MKFVGRKVELLELNSHYNSLKKEFGIIYGKKDIGKTALIVEFLKEKNYILFQAKKDNNYGNLKSFSNAINLKINNSKDFVFNSYKDAFDAISEYIKSHRLILVIDEYQYILKQNLNFQLLIEDFINKANDNIMLILLGSDVAFIKNELINSSLYKKMTFKMQLNKLSFDEGALFLKDFNNEMKIKYLSLFSTYPFYLQAIERNLSFDENIKKLLFNQYGIFFSLPEKELSNITKTQDVYNAILLAISNNYKSNKEISYYTHEEESKIAKYLITLQDNEIVKKCETFMGNKKTIYYEINDSLLKFYYRFIFLNEERIKINGIAIFNELNEKIKQFITNSFEDVCKLYVEQLNKNLKLNTIYQKLKPYKAYNSTLNRSIEIDGLALENNSLLVVECKYKNKPFSKEMLNNLKESVSIFDNNLEKYYYIFSKLGFDNSLINNNDRNVYLITLEDMFKKY